MMNNYNFQHPSPAPGGSHTKPTEQLTNDIINASLFRNDKEFDWLYPEHFQLMSSKQWTPLAIVRKAAKFLSVPGAKVLDIGSGIGKFCLAAGYHFPETFFYGVEQRHELICLAEEAKRYTSLSNINFIYANITQINFKEFDHFYFYNSFYENIDPINRIDDTIETSYSLYAFYSQYLLSVLKEKPSGTRLVTFHSSEREIPPDYILADFSYDRLLKMWIKQ